MSWLLPTTILKVRTSAWMCLSVLYPCKFLRKYHHKKGGFLFFIFFLFCNPWRRTWEKLENNTEGGINCSSGMH
ncbi:hypothetical protein VNO80_11621 [Phaseolus coccineus]|uniref:Uncharacterized protein n=1 Tax=Phaseolus coccineus TaxID=3886 RepID=A0AAN9NAQ3_PHACN